MSTTTESKIEWTHYTFNPWRGCTKVSEGCKNCYAETLSKRNPGTLGVWGPNGQRVVAAESYWKGPIKWDREAKAEGVRKRVFCASLADVFEDWTGPMVDATPQTVNVGRSPPFRLVRNIGDGPPWIASTAGESITMHDVRIRLSNLIDWTPNLDWLILTKRPENITRMLPRCVRPNLWLGTSVENQAAADERIPHLLRVPAAVRFLSCEPLLGAIEFSDVTGRSDAVQQLGKKALSGIHWVIAGGESGPNARPMHPDWARSLRDQCQAAGVAFQFKQWGEWGPEPEGDWLEKNIHWFQDGPGEDEGTHVWRVGKANAGRLLDGRTWDELPEAK